MVRLSIGFRSKSRTSSDFSFEKVERTKIQSIFQENRFKKRDIKDFGKDILQKRAILQKSEQIDSLVVVCNFNTKIKI
jgi:hypothetical protein